MSWHDRLRERDAGYVTPCLEWTGATQKGYGVVSVRGRYVRVHRLAWAEAHGDPGSLFVCHHCDNRLCARVDHLFLGTNATNMQDAARKGRTRNGRLQGEDHGRARLTEVQIHAIRADPRTLREIGAAYGVHLSTISLIKRRKNWRHI